MTNQNLLPNSIGRIFQQNNYQKQIDQIKSQSFIFSTKTEEELKEIIEKIKRRLTKETLNDILPDWFAITREISFRTIGLKHFDTQLLSGILLHQGKVVEMKTGEGKTLASTLSVSLNSLSEKGVHVVTVNEYLAQRDQQSMGKINPVVNPKPL
jgi:preprotein translocase subunit SecA